jgi:hypothetical protein
VVLLLWTSVAVTKFRVSGVVGGLLIYDILMTLNATHSVISMRTFTLQYNPATGDFIGAENCRSFSKHRTLESRESYWIARVNLMVVCTCAVSTAESHNQSGGRGLS